MDSSVFKLRTAGTDINSCLSKKMSYAPGSLCVLTGEDLLLDWM